MGDERDDGNEALASYDVPTVLEGNGRAGATPVSGVGDTVLQDSGAPVATEDMSASTHPADLPQLQAVSPQAYAIGRELARGGMGRIRYGRDLRHGRPVAVKELLLEGNAAIARFEREAMITARLQHPAIVPVYEAGHWPDGRPFYAMKMVRGRPLHEVLQETQTFEDRLALLPNLIAVAEAMAYAHDKRVVHRDLKPANILVGAFGETVVIDWGLAKDLSVATDHDETLEPIAPTSSGALHPQLTAVGSAMGTPGYMPIEQANGDDVDERADVYALGATLYHVLGGIAPYGDEPPTANLMAVLLDHEPTPLAEVEPRVPPDLMTIVDKAMARHKRDRYPSAKQLAEDLRLFQTGQLVESYDYSRAELLMRWLRRHRAVLAVAALLVGIGAATTAWFLGREEQLVAEQQQVSDRAEELEVSMLLERGRAALLAGEPLRALVYLSEAYSAGRRTVAVRSLLADAARPLSGIVATVERPGVRVYGLARSPDGKTVLTATDYGTRVSDGDTGEALRTLDQGSRVLSVAFAQSGARFITATQDKPARIVDAEDPSAVVEIGRPVDWATLSPDGARVLSRKWDAAQVWNARTGELVAETKRDGPVLQAAFVPGADLVATVAERGGVVLSRASTGKRVRAFADGATAIAPSPDGALIATAHEDGKTRVWAASSGALVATIDAHARPVTSVAYRPDGAWLLTTGEDSLAKLYDARASYAHVVTLEGHKGVVTGGAFSPAGAVVATFSRDGTAKVWDIDDRALLSSLEHGADVTGASFAPDGETIATAGVDGAKLWKTRTSKLVSATRNAREGIALSVVSPDGGRVVTAGATGPAYLADAESGQRLATLAHQDAITGAAFSRDGAAIVTTGRDGAAVIWDAEAGLRRASLAHDGAVVAAAFRDTAASVVTASAKGALTTWTTAGGDYTAGKSVRTDAAIDLAAFSADGSLAITAHPDHTAALWRIDDGAKIAALPAHRDAITSAAFSPDGVLVATGSRDATARIWRAATGAFVASLSGHEAEIARVSFSDDSARLVTASADGTARIWDATDGTLLATLDNQGRPLVSAVFGLDGKVVVASAADGASFVWDCHLETRSAAEIQRIVRNHVPFVLDGGRVVPKEVQR